MKFTTQICVFLTVFSLVNTLYGQENFKTAANGIKYKIHTIQSGKKIQLNNIITFNLIEKTEKDSVLFSTYHKGKPLKAQVVQSQNITDFMDLFILLSDKDSAQILIPTDSIFKDQEFDRPGYLPKGSALIFIIKIEKVQTIQEAVAEEELALDAERSLLAKYIADHHLKPLFTSSGLLYVVKKQTKRLKPEPGDTVLINYTASTIGGKVFDSSIKSRAVEAGLEQPGRDYSPISVIVAESGTVTAWDEGLLLMNEGSTTTFIIPSYLAFGAMGYADLIEPYTTLVVDVELIKIKGRGRTKSEDKKSKNQDLKNIYKPEYPGLKAGRENKQGQSMIIHHFSGVTFLKQLFVK
jgi:FKBP-type peptidyl-prolyl cis-trans isomerase FkpA